MVCSGKTPWEIVVEFHGHSCPGLAVGYRVAQIALRELKELRSPDEELVAVVENDACGVDAIMLLTGCTLGKGNLIFRDYGKQVYTIGSRNSGRALRISVNGEALYRPEGPVAALRKKVFEGTATPDEKKKFYEHQAKRTDFILNMPEGEFCKTEEIDYRFPGRARIFNSVRCAGCGEYVMETRARVKDSRPVCIPCSDDYSRGW